eukprot:TRINITY_DN10169_c0_g2_i1.p1 TRINITY_DN10169_c0_g2~~TRINITY_DN10169_c0_g2_i1.p1  ORF type:complete len:1097 (+),score=282.56 TRINITY_DN10169_c0_g2_i1:231-3521(+)
MVCLECCFPLVTCMVSCNENAEDKRLPLAVRLQYQRKDYDKIQDLVEDAVRATGKLSRVLSWKKYFQLIYSFVSKFGSRDRGQDSESVEDIWRRVSVRVACGILDNFTFNEERDENFSAITKDIRGTLIPPLVKFLDLDGKQQVKAASNSKSTLTLKNRVIVATALVRFLKQLPKAMCDQQIPWLITGLSRACGDKDQEVRDQTRQTLVSVAVALGPEYFGFIISELRHCLSYDFKLHARGYVVNTLLNAVAESFPVGSIDYCLVNILEVLFDHLVGEAALLRAKWKDDDHNASGLRKMKEMSEDKAVTGFEYLAKLIDFETSIPVVIEQLEKLLSKCSSNKSFGKAERALEKMCVGFKNNSSATTHALLVFSVAVISKHKDSPSPNSDSEGDKRKQSSASSYREAQKQRTMMIEVPAAKVQRNLDVDKGFLGRWQGVGNDMRISETMAVFGLQNMNSVLRYRMEECTQLASAQVDYFTPVVELLSCCCCSKETKLSSSMRVLSLGLRNITAIVKLPKVAETIEKPMKKLAPRFANVAMATIATASGVELARVCFDTMSALMRNCTEFTVEKEHLTTLLFHVEKDIYDAERQVSAFPLLRSIMFRKFISPQVYDVMTRLMELMVQHENPAIRKQCSNALLQFLMDYPMKDNRRQQHLHFLVNNMRYEHPSGRLAVLELIRVIICKFPQSMLDANIEIVFLPVVQRLTAEEDQEVIKSLEEVLVQLLSRVSQEKFEKAVSFCLAWAQAGQKQSLQRASLFVLRAVLEFSSKLSNSQRSIKLQSMLKICAFIDEVLVNHIEQIQSIVEQASSGDERLDSSSLAWGLLHQSLLFLEQVIKSFWSEQLSDTLHGLLERTLSLSLFPHPWIRSTLHRTWTCWVEKDASSKQFKSEIAHYLMDQLRQEKQKLTGSTSISDWVSCLYAFSKEDPELIQLSTEQLCKFGKHSRENCDKASPLLYLEKVFNGGIPVICLTEKTLLQAAGLFQHLNVFDNSTKEISAEVKVLAEKVKNDLQSMVGKERLIELIHMCRMKKMEQKEHRKKQDALIALIDPEFHNKKKMYAQQKKRHLLKRKMEEIKLVRKGHAQEVAQRLAKRFKSK